MENAPNSAAAKGDLVEFRTELKSDLEDFKVEVNLRFRPSNTGRPALMTNARCRAKLMRSWSGIRSKNFEKKDGVAMAYYSWTTRINSSIDVSP